ncbi:type II toxin-antitoxin system VapC family toxin [Streptomyces huiliensis]|uniref:type II toxin-antitoxin system VapC family toxin n=1 Tax=Streptomyces huiliensis TaxID=2876027 RepID=UPI001CC15E9D|nr:PIN domain-containing protein [Streptomyces huiliensis]MBZ4320127.1 PIN domain-containing protein [Streptomyces huiliensis]
MSGTLVLDSEALSKLCRRHRTMTMWLDVARRLDLVVVTSAATLVEARDPKAPQAAFDHAVSLTKVRPVTEEIARAAGKLLTAEGLHGHKYAIDAMLAATAHAEHGNVTVITSDVDDLRRLCRPHIAVEAV